MSKESWIQNSFSLQPLHLFGYGLHNIANYGMLGLRFDAQTGLTIMAIRRPGGGLITTEEEVNFLLLTSLVIASRVTFSLFNDKIGYLPPAHLVQGGRVDLLDKFFIERFRRTGNSDTMNVGSGREIPSVYLVVGNFSTAGDNKRSLPQRLRDNDDLLHVFQPIPIELALANMTLASACGKIPPTDFGDLVDKNDVVHFP